jgi:hypothetical protein
VIEQAASTPVMRRARLAGLLYLVVIAGGLFAGGFVIGSIVAPGDAAATAQAIAENEPIWRAGLTVHLLYLGAATAVNLLLYRLFKPVQATLARLALLFNLVAIAVETASLLFLSVPLALLAEDDALTMLGEAQSQALTYLAVNLYSTGFGFALVFFAGFCVLIGTLIMQSQLIPRIIGAAMITAGVCYVVNSLAFIISPPLSNTLFPWIVLPSLVGELSLTLWLLVKGVKAPLRRKSSTVTIAPKAKKTADHQ